MNPRSSTQTSPRATVRHLVAAIAFVGCVSPAQSQQVITVGIGTQNTTTNTVTGGIVIQQLGLLEKHLPTDGKYQDIEFRIEWQNFTSGPPVTNGMVANTLQIGMMGDYPLLVNGATFQGLPETDSKLIALIAYNADGAGNGLVVHQDSPYYELSDLKGKRVSVPFGSAAHGMLLKAMEDRGWGSDYFELSSQNPEVGTSSLQEKRIDGHANFVPFAELLPYRGFARKIFDGVETNQPTFHGVVVREDFAQAYPEFVVAYIKALLEANEWVRSDPVRAAEKVAEWTRIDKEVAYIFLSPGGIHTLDATIKPQWIEATKYNHGVLQRMGRVRDLDADAWVDERYVRQAFAEFGLDYDAQKVSFDNYEISGTDPLCGGDIDAPRKAGEVWTEGDGVTAYRSVKCTLAAVRKATAEGRKVGVAYVFDHSLAIKLFADKAFYALGNDEVVPFLLRKDAEAYASANGGRVAGYDEALAAASLGD